MKKEYDTIENFILDEYRKRLIEEIEKMDKYELYNKKRTGVRFINVEDVIQLIERRGIV